MSLTCSCVLMHQSAVAAYKMCPWRIFHCKAENKRYCQGDSLGKLGNFPHSYFLKTLRLPLPKSDHLAYYPISCMVLGDTDGKLYLISTFKHPLTIDLIFLNRILYVFSVNIRSKRPHLWDFSHTRFESPTSGFEFPIFISVGSKK